MSAHSDPDTPPDLAAEFSAAIAWWDEAGVDSDFADDATDWLAAPAPAQTPKKKRSDNPGSSPAERLQVKNLQSPLEISPETLPDKLADFQEWWLESEALAPVSVGKRIPPRGLPGASLMVIVAEPEHGDSERLLSGPDGKMLDAMLRAMGLDPGEVYLAAALPAPMPMADFAALTAAGLKDVTARHITLVAPKRLLIFGSGILPLFAHDTAQDAAGLDEINHESGTVPAMAARALANLRNLPGDRARFWRRWLRFTDDKHDT